jgi:UDP-2,3-diacylglucosamine pyrophosphatase LpxH
MNAIVVSDLHVGSRYFLHEIFDQFIQKIPEDYALILNGDVIDNLYVKLKPPHQRILDLIEQISYRQKVIWVRGNHDNGYVPKGFGKVLFKNVYAIENKVLIAHGDYFDGIMPYNRAFIKAFKVMHDLRVRLGARPVHVAEYAKKWKTLYGVLRRNIMINAISYAGANGYGAVICGHTHYAEDRVLNGIRYINTGSWTEFPVFYLRITVAEMTLQKIEGPSTSLSLKSGNDLARHDEPVNFN